MWTILAIRSTRRLFGRFYCIHFWCGRIVNEYKTKGDDYSRFLVQSLADHRFVEAFAEHLHEQFVKEFWGYKADEVLDNEAVNQRKICRYSSNTWLPRLPQKHSESGVVFEPVSSEKKVEPN